MTAEMNSSDVMEKLTKQNIPLLNIQDVDYSQATETATSKRNRSKQDPLSLRPGLITRTDHNQSQTKTSSANSSVKSQRAVTVKGQLSPILSSAENLTKNEEEVYADTETANDSDYDTDLEFEDAREEYDPTGRKAYREACSQLGIIPVSFVLDRITKEDIDIKHHGLGPNGARAIAIALMGNTTTTSLNLRDCAIGPEGGDYIARLLRENFYISELDLAQNKIQSPGAQAISMTLIDNSSIKKLNLSWNELKNKDAVYLTEAIRVNQTLTWLDLSHNGFAEEAGLLFGPAIDSNSALENLNLSWNHLRGKGAVAIGKGLRANCSLKTLDLSWNGFADEGAAAVGESLKENNTLLNLDLSNNRISTQGAMILAKGLQVNNTLKMLRIGMNPIQNDGALSLLTAMKNNMDSAIEKMLLNNVVVNLETQELAKFLLGQRPGLTIVCTMSKLSGKHGDQLDQPHGDNRKKKQLIYILKKYVEDKNYRVVDLFNQFDKDKSMSVTREEFRIGLKSIGVPMTDAQLTDLIDILDEDGDGEIDYGEFTWINEVE